MKKLIRIVLVVMIMLSAQNLTAYADRGGHGGHGGHSHGGHGGSVGVVISPGWWGYSYPYYPYYPYYPDYAQPPVVIRESPDLYVQPAPQSDETGYWYYCPDSRGYYPDVKKCPQGWLKVVPPAEPPAGKE